MAKKTRKNGPARVLKFPSGKLLNGDAVERPKKVKKPVVEEKPDPKVVVDTLLNLFTDKEIEAIRKGLM